MERVLNGVEGWCFYLDGIRNVFYLFDYMDGLWL